MVSDPKTGFLMIQGTMSGAGKSLIVAGLCRLFARKGIRVSPFKSQNMALNSFVTADGFEMGRAQVVQAEAAGIEPEVYMNPILLKPTDDVGSQVIVNGRPVGNMAAREYFEYKKTLIPVIKDAVYRLSEKYELIVIEGAGSPAEINLKENDIVNMGMAELVDAPVLLVGDIDRGGVFAQLYGTVSLLEEEERRRIRGLIINKFRGDKSLLKSGIDMIEEKTHIPVLGVFPYINVRIDDEDSMSLDDGTVMRGEVGENAADIAVIKLPHISNYTDFGVFGEYEGVSIRYVDEVRDMGNPDMLVIPGTKSTIADSIWLVKSGLGDAVKGYAAAGGVVFGICGGYQLLGRSIRDPHRAEGGGEAVGLSLLPVDTVLSEQKLTKQTTGCFGEVSGKLAALSGLKYTGYEIHMGETRGYGDYRGLMADGSGCQKDNVLGTYIHGLFDEGEIAAVILKAISGGKSDGFSRCAHSHADFKEEQYNILADMIEENCNMGRIYDIVGIDR